MPTIEKAAEVHHLLEEFVALYGRYLDETGCYEGASFWSNDRVVRIESLLLRGDKTIMEKPKDENEVEKQPQETDPNRIANLIHDRYMDIKLLSTGMVSLQVHSFKGLGKLDKSIWKLHALLVEDLDNSVSATAQRDGVTLFSEESIKLGSVENE